MGNHGGKREGAGRKLKYGEKTSRITIECPVSKKSELREYIYKKLNEWALKK